MKTIFMLGVLLTYGCSSLSPRATMADAKYENKSIITLDNLEHVESWVARFAHPLVCGEGGDYPHGRELVFRVDRTSPPIHAVFPDAEKTPESLDGKFRLYGFYQNIQNFDRFIHLHPGEDYQYFVVSSWKNEEGTSNNTRH